MTKYFAVYNMGHSGSTWFGKVCNSHPDVYCVVEPAHELNLLKLPSGVRERREIDYLKKAAKTHDAVGVIKSFSTATKHFILEHYGEVFQLVRNPLAILDFKAVKKHQWHRLKKVLGRPARNYEEAFAGTVELYAKKYQKYIKRRDVYSIIRLEDLSTSLAYVGIEFQMMLEQVTGVFWTARQAAFVRDNVIPHGNKWTRKLGYPEPIGWGPDPVPEIAWNSWKQWQRKLVRKKFGKIMKELGYTMPEG